MPEDERKEIWRTLVLAIFAIILCGWVLVNATFKAGIIYLVLIMITIFFLLAWEQLKKLVPR